MAKIEFKHFVLEKLTSASEEVQSFVGNLGFFFAENKLIITGPDAPNVEIAPHLDTITQAAMDWASEHGITYQEVVVNAGGKPEVSLSEYASQYREDAQTNASQFTGSFIEEDIDTDEDDQVDDSELNGVQYDNFNPDELSSDQLVAQSNQLNGFADIISRNHEQQETKQPQPNEENNAYATEGGAGSGIADLLKGTSKLFAKPITVPATLLASSAKRLNHWRLDRPNRMLAMADETSVKLIQNIQTFKDDDYLKLEAEVKARGGWDFELSQKFESFLEVGKRKENWKLIVTQMKQFGHYSKKAVETNRGQAQEVMDNIDDRAAQISASASDIPYSVKKGTVAQTVYEMSEQLRESIREMVQRIIKLILNVGGSDKASPSP
ncbi:MAG: hypothetical protein CTY35_00395 [Methylotenera sp.]|uniref:hypothetical protein n=1 Tax=Methylotenera sp. TaxID=2051956 RepID=UPI000D4554F4|nr:hypothetical protein [Methylotenera sp.]PPC84814.1 MAG: hypothetical protein CTY38_00390 [Methylotenera sp.]PPD02174.1 MAG: hypothetical protein CTY35_00395 [Methylotenera sp.]